MDEATQCRPFDRFELDAQICKLAGLLGVTLAPHVTIDFGNGQKCRVEIKTADIERDGKESSAAQPDEEAAAV